MPLKWKNLAIGLAGFLALASRANADAIVVSKAMTASTIAEIFIGQSEIRIDLEIGANDLQGFRNLMPDALYEKLGHEPEPLSGRLRRFFEEDWVIRADGGQPLLGLIESMEPGRRIERDQVTGEPLPNQPEDADIVVRAQLAYTLATRPASLSLRPPTATESNYANANVGFVVYHLGLPVNDFRYLSQEETLALDWEDPWYSRFQNRNLRRSFDAPLSAFLYVEHFEVRKEIIIRPKDAQQWLDLGLEDRAILPVAQQADLKRSITDFLAPLGQVLIDGKHVEPVLDRVHFIRRTLRRTGVIDPPEDLDLASATLGVIFVYPIASLPQEVTLAWDLFSPRIQQIASSATDEAGGLPSLLTPQDPILRWQNFLTHPKVPAMLAVAPPPAPWRVTLPLISALCGSVMLALALATVHRAKAKRGWPPGLIAGCAIAGLCGTITLPYAKASFAIPLLNQRTIKPEQARDVLGGLLHNVYRAFDWRDESAIYDRLALSIAGDLLSDVYLQTRRSMELEGQGGARVKVDEVDILEAIPDRTSDKGGFVYRCRWNVSGSVGHWGHLHQRINQYDAVFTVEPVEGSWRIAAIDLREEKRVDPSARSQARGT